MRLKSELYKKEQDEIIEQEERQNKFNRNKNRINNTNKRIFKSK